MVVDSAIFSDLVDPCSQFRATTMAKSADLFVHGHKEIERSFFGVCFRDAHVGREEVGEGFEQTVNEVTECDRGAILQPHKEFCRVKVVK